MSTDSPKPRILIVDDHADTRDLFAIKFSAAGAEVLSARNGQEAVDTVQQELTNSRSLRLILLDIHMPVMNGMSAAAAIRKLGFRGKIIAFTAVQSGEWRKASLEAGVDGYFSKSVFTKELIAALLTM